MYSISALSASTGSSDGGASVSSQISAFNKQLQSITKQVKELSDNQDLTDEQKSEMEQMYHSQIAIRDDASCCPASVSITSRMVRSNSRTPIAASSSLMLWLTR